MPPVADYFKRIRAICDRYGVLLILDEVMCGMGRTGTLHACEQEGIAPDLMTIAKGLGGGYQPIGAVLLAQKIFDAFANGSGVFQHGHTYLNHPMACAAALAVQNVIKRDDLLDNVRRRASISRGACASASAIIPMSAISAAAACFRRSSSSPIAAPRRRSIRRLKLHARVKKEAMARGLLVYPSGGTIDGARGDHVLIAPPFIVDATIRSTTSSNGSAMRSMPRSAVSIKFVPLDLKRGGSTLVAKPHFAMHNLTGSIRPVACEE